MGGKLGETLAAIKSRYVEASNEDSLTDVAIQSMLETLDPHSVYIPASDLQAANERLDGNFEGVGIEFNLLNDTVEVVNVIPGGPSDEVGLHAGDRIIKIEGKNIAGIKLKSESLIKQLRGAKGTKVTISIKRYGVKNLLDFTITRGKIPLYSISATYMATPVVGYIKLDQFSATSSDEFQKAIKQLRAEGMRKLILDLRDNGGGFLNTATDLADQFLSDNKLIVYTEGRTSARKEYKAENKGLFEEGELVVLIDENSASASEILSGALQDWDRATIIGRRSFGKGLVQEPIQLSDGSVIRLTVARYYTPSGRCIQKSYKNGYDAYENDLQQRFKHGELASRDSFHLPDSLKFKTHNGRTVYAGGGIMPDIFIPLDTSAASAFALKIYNSGLLNEYVLSSLNNSRDRLKKQYPNFNSFNRNFDVTPMLNGLIGYAVSKGIKGSSKNNVWLGQEIKAYVARQLYSNSAFWQVLNEEDKTFKKAVEILGR